MLGMEIGTVLQPTYPSRSLQQKQFNHGTVTYHWARRESKREIYNRSYVDKQIHEAHEAEMAMLLNHILFRETYSDWLKQIWDRKELIAVVRTQVRDLITLYSAKGIRDFNVVNEPWPKNNHLFSVIGESYIDIAYEEAFEVREEIRQAALKNSKPVPVIRLGFSNAENHYAAGSGTQPTCKYAQQLTKKGYLDYVDSHFHLKRTSNLPKPEDVIKTLDHTLIMA